MHLLRNRMYLFHRCDYSIARLKLKKKQVYIVTHMHLVWKTVVFHIYIFQLQ